jgi:hypothetical protein
MNILTAVSGWLWIKRGFQIFRKQPAEMLTLFFIYMFFNMGIGLIPFVGQFLPLILVPVFALNFMQACRQIEAGERVYPNLHLFGFRSPALPNLLKLGLLYILAATMAIAASSLFDGGVFWNLVTSTEPVDPKTLPESGLILGMTISAFAYIPAMMGFWYAAPLIAWNNMGVSKAVFYSFFAVWRAAKSFLVYGFAWFLISVFLSMVLSLLVAIIGGSGATLMIVLMPISIAMTVVMYCSFYPTYTDVFVPPGIGAHIEEVV